MTTRPVGVSAGGVGLLLAWIGGAAIARITGATPVVIVLAAGVVLFLAAAADGWYAVRSCTIGALDTPGTATQGDQVVLAASVRATRPTRIEVRAGPDAVAEAWITGERWTAHGSFPRRGIVEEFTLGLRSAGGLGLVWWERRVDRAIEPVLVGARARQAEIRVDRSTRPSRGESAGDAGAISGEIDGIRPWRDGDSERFVHWSSTLRSGELVVHDRRRDAHERWVVRPRTGTDDPDREAGGARWALEQGLRAGATMSVAIDDEPQVAIEDAVAAARWSAEASLGAAPTPATSPWWSRQRVEPESTAQVSARWWSAGATLVALVMLTSTLGHGAATAIGIAAAVVAGAVVSSRTLTTGEQPPVIVRGLIGLGALAGLGSVVASSGRLDGLLTFLRGPLPMVLVILVLLHGFECRDRRTIRVGLGIAAVVVMYASAFRVDGTLGWWLFAWAACFVVALSQLSGPTDRSAPDPADGLLSGLARSSGMTFDGWPRRIGASGAAAVATIGLLAVVPVPEGPARLTLPTFVDDAMPVAQPGAVAGPDGEVRSGDRPSQPGSDRAPAGQAGGYTGFAQSMDTSVRGELSDEIVMRVRAPEPDFWRGQTFAEFDGRTWYADADPGSIRLGPTVALPPALGDAGEVDGIEVDRFVQTFHLEADMPNVVFHAYRPTQVIIDADVWTRPDGAIRAATVLPAGSIYTVVSARPRVDAAVLRRQGVIGPRLNELGRSVLARYLEVPQSTSPETIALATQLAAGQPSTYDTVRAYEAWLGANVEYDLNAPLPEPGEDAVHDFLFDTRLGFCEQIASAMTVMLRTKGVPARLATGFLPGARNQIAGVFEVKASDAHAWVEVWFPESGWQPFDPTASVPLSADNEIESIGADLTAAAGRWIGRNRSLVAFAAAIVLVVLGAFRLVRLVAHRRRRGRWGLLQDRFAAAAARRGAPTGATNPRRAASWTADDTSARARQIAERLDQAAFDPAFVDDDDSYDATRKLIGALPPNGQ